MKSVIQCRVVLPLLGLLVVLQPHYGCDAREQRQHGVTPFYDVFRQVVFMKPTLEDEVFFDTGEKEEFLVLKGEGPSTIDGGGLGQHLRGGQRKLQSSSESTHVNIWQKLKESIGATIVGILLICFTPCLLWWNEGRHVKQLKRIDFCKKTATSIDPNSPTDENNGVLVHFRGQVSVDGAELGSGDKFDVRIPGAVVLKRTILIYQRSERAEQKTESDRLGGGETRTTEYTVEEGWVPQPQPEQLPHLPDVTNSHGIWGNLAAAAGGDASTPNLVVASRTHVGAFQLSQEVIKEHPFQFCSEWRPVPSDLIPESVEGCEGLVKGMDGVLKTFEDGSAPQNGDCKVVFEYVADGFDCSFIGEQTPASAPVASSGPDAPLLTAGGEEDGVDDTRYGMTKCVVVDSGCCKYGEGELGDIWMVQRGSHPLEDMVETANDQEAKIQKLLRLLLWVLLCAGWVMLFSPFVTALSVLPILGKLGYFAVVLVALIVSLVCCCAVMAIAYVRYRPLLAFGIIALAGAITGIVIWRLDYAAANGGGQQ